MGNVHGHFSPQFRLPIVSRPLLDLQEGLMNGPFFLARFQLLERHTILYFAAVSLLGHQSHSNGDGRDQDQGLIRKDGS